MKKKDLRETLSHILSAEDLARVYKSFDIVGDIAITRFKPESKKHHLTIANAIMDVHKNVRTVLAQTSSVRGNFRLRKLDYISGENRTVTIHKEFGCLFRVDVRKSYFSPRLIHERMRIARQVGNQEKLVNMFAGVGSYSIIIAKHSNAAKVFSVDINAVAVRYMRENVLLNKAFDKVFPIEGDARTIVENKLPNVADRVLMPLPEKAYE